MNILTNSNSKASLRHRPVETQLPLSAYCLIAQSNIQHITYFSVFVLRIA